jgi:hypothetical protein
LTLNPGWCVTQDGGVPVSCKTSSECKLLTHLGISWQHWHSYAFWSNAVSQLPHLHLRFI